MRYGLRELWVLLTLVGIHLAVTSVVYRARDDEIVRQVMMIAMSMDVCLVVAGATAAGGVVREFCIGACAGAVVSTYEPLSYSYYIAQRVLELDVGIGTWLAFVSQLVLFGFGVVTASRFIAYMSVHSSCSRRLLADHSQKNH